MIHTICCVTCGMPVFEVEDNDFHQPLRGEMLRLIRPKDYMVQPGLVKPSFLCPHCYGFPFFQDRDTGQVLQRVMVPSGQFSNKVVELPIIEVAEIVDNRKVYGNVANDVDKSTNSVHENKVTCPECGAKANRSGKITFHKKGCSLVKSRSADHAPNRDREKGIS